MADIVQTPAALYTLYRYERLFISLAKPSLLNWDASAFKLQSHQIALSTSESSPNCTESIPVLDASQNFKICIGFLSLDINSFFMLNLLYHSFCVNLLLFIILNTCFRRVDQNRSACTNCSQYRVKITSNFTLTHCVSVKAEMKIRGSIMCEKYLPNTLLRIAKGL